MNKSIKLNDNTYLDSSCVVDNRTPLTDDLKLLKSFNDTKGADYKEMLRNKIEYCKTIVANKSRAQMFLNGGWSGINYGFGIYSKIGTIHQIVWFSSFGIHFCSVVGDTYKYFVFGGDYNPTDITTVNCTVSSGVTINSQPVAKKNNLTKTVQISGIMTRDMTLGKWNDLCTIPSGYRPPITWDFGGVNNACDTLMHIRIHPDGKVQVFPTTYTAPSGTSSVPVYINTMYML